MKSIILLPFNVSTNSFFIKTARENSIYIKEIKSESKNGNPYPFKQQKGQGVSFTVFHFQLDIENMLIHHAFRMLSSLFIFLNAKPQPFNSKLIYITSICPISDPWHDFTLFLLQYSFDLFNNS